MDELERLHLKLKERWVDGNISGEQYWKMKNEILTQPKRGAHSEASERSPDIDSDKAEGFERNDEVGNETHIAIEENSSTLWQEHLDYSISGDVENAEERLSRMISLDSIVSLVSREPAELSNVNTKFAELADLPSTLESNRVLGASSLRAKENEHWRDSIEPPCAASPERRQKSGHNVAMKGVASTKAKELQAIISLSLESIGFASDYLRYSVKIALAMGIALAFSMLVLPLVIQ